MSAFEEYAFSAQDFSGQVRLFPLPNLILFPHVMQPLHVFEPRYRALLEESLVGDRLIAMAILLPGWEKQYEGRPPVHPMACLGRVAVHHRLEDGTYNALLVGLRRVRLIRELPATKTFREAEVLVLEDRYPADEAELTAGLHRQLRDALMQAVPELPQAHDQLDQLLSGETSLGTLTDIISYMVDIDVRQKQVLLAEVNVHRRAQILLKHLSITHASPGADSPGDDFPPSFSAN
jgi:ATP-dependent Lon protease